MRYSKGETPLHYAVRANNHEVVELLLAMGADQDIAGVDVRRARLVPRRSSPLSSFALFSLLFSAVICRLRPFLPLGYRLSSRH